jgi:homoserine kinase
MRNSSSAPEQVTVFAPGTSANVGPGFDCLGMAFTGKGDRVIARRVEGGGVRVLSVSDPRIPLDPLRNTAAIAAASVLRRLGREVGIEIRIEKGLPLAGGMGGSAASAAAGAVAADALAGAGLSKLDLVEAAMDAEEVVAGRHADNIAPAVLGGAVIVISVDPLAIVPIRVHPDLALVLVSPAYLVETQKARAVLPTQIPRADAIAQAAHLVGLALGLERGDRDLIARSMVDRIAEPFRAPLYPGYPEAKAAGLAAGAFGVVVSGAGPTVIAVAPPSQQEAVAAAMKRAYAGAGHASETHCASVDNEGARVVASS